MNTAFVHLLVHTEYSLIDSVVRVPKLMGALAEQAAPAVALTDFSNVFAMVKFYRSALGKNIKPIIGVDALLAADGDAAPSRIVLLCMNHEGYGNLTRLVSKGWQEGQHLGVPYLKKEWIFAENGGLIALCGGPNGEIGQALLKGKTTKAKALAQEWAQVFASRFYLQLQRTERANEEEHLHAAVDLALNLALPVVAVNDVRFVSQTDFAAHEARVCIHDGVTLDDTTRPQRYSEQQYLKSPEEMAELFVDIPEALENTVHIARRCTLELTLGKNFLPQFPIPEGMTTEEFFCEESRKGLEQRLPILMDVNAPNFAELRKPYDERLQIELDVINQMGFPGYFLIVADFIQWAKDNAVPVGPGRGSGAGSLVAYALKITDLDPLKYDLLFERFLNPERVSMPDFDVDFCMEGRDRVIEYVAEHYGREKVSQIITYGSMAAKAVVRDVGRVFGHSYGFVDRIAKMIPFEVGMTLSKAMEDNPDLKQAYDQDEEVRTLMDMALSLEGLTRNVGKHAGGVVIAPSVLTDFTPLYCEEGGQGLVTQFDKDDVESIGLVKFDFLGLRTLTIIDWALQAINDRLQKQGKEAIDINLIPLDDKPSFDLLQRAETTAVFQLESRGMKELIKKLKPSVFEDIVALVALYRPGPLGSGMVDDFIARKHGKAAIEYPHPDLETVLQPTYGTILYQEQVMQIAQILAGYSLGGADLLRRAMGKKKKEVMDEQRVIFVTGATERKIPSNQAEHIFDLMAEFAKYGFNKSHSAAYALVSYQTAWLKAHFPAAFMAAVSSSDMDNTEKVVIFIEECKRMKIVVLPPNINTSNYRFEVQDDDAVRYGLGAIKGVGESAIESILHERECNGPYADLVSFCCRVDGQKVNKRVLEALVKSGAFDVFGNNRASTMAAIPEALQLAEQYNRDLNSGQSDLFGETAIPEPVNMDLQQRDEWEEIDKLKAEKETLGLFLSGHPINAYGDEVKKIAKKTLGEWIKAEGSNRQAVVVAGLIIDIRVITGAKGKRAVVTLDDDTGRLEVTLFTEQFEEFGHLLQMDTILVVEGAVAYDDYNGGYRISSPKRVVSFDEARQQFIKALILHLHQPEDQQIQTLATQLADYREGQCTVLVRYNNQQAKADYRLGAAWRIVPQEALLKNLRHLVGEQNVILKY